MRTHVRYFAMQSRTLLVAKAVPIAHRIEHDAAHLAEPRSKAAEMRLERLCWRTRRFGIDARDHELADGARKRTLAPSRRENEIAHADRCLELVRIAPSLHRFLREADRGGDLALARGAEHGGAHEAVGGRLCVSRLSGNHTRHFRPTASYWRPLTCVIIGIDATRTWNRRPALTLHAALRVRFRAAADRPGAVAGNDHISSGTPNAA